MQKQSILITGGAGFIGSRLARNLAKNTDNQVWILDNLHPQIHGQGATAPVFPENVHFVKGDICDRSNVEAILKDANPDLVFHLVSETGTGQSMDKIVCYCDVNVSGTAILLESIREFASNTKKIVLPSSRAIYGEGAHIDINDNPLVPDERPASRMDKGQFLPVDKNEREIKAIATIEDTPASPISVYASTKLIQEQLIKQIGSTQPWDATILRLQNVYGAGQSLKNPYTGVLSIFSQQLLSGNKINIYEDGEIIRDFIYVDDVVNALMAAADSTLPHGTTLNIGTGQPSSILDVAKILIDKYDMDKDSFYVSGDYRPGDIRYAVADISKSVELLDWKPKIALEEGLEKLAAWCKEEVAANR